MPKNKTQARRLAALLTADGFDAQVNGGGVHWRVDVAPVRDRSARVHCYWYEAALSGLLLGMNPANSASSLRKKTAFNVGPEFEVVIAERGGDRRDGRTSLIQEAAFAVKSWLSGGSVEELAAVVPFVDRAFRELRALGARFDPRLRWEAFGYPPAIWAYGERRSCRLETDSCTFFIGDAAIAQALDPIDFPDHVAAWLLEGATLAELAGRGVELGRHAEVLESGDAARWHWRRVRDRVANPDDVLAPLAPLISLVIASPIASRFYSFSSLNRLCFSASSHYPFVGQYPVVYPGPDGKYFVDDVPCSLQDAVARIESALAASSIEPFFGSATDYEATLLAESLGRHGSAIQPRIIRRGSSSDVWLIVPPRQCSVAETILECFGEGRKVCVICRCVDDIVALALRFLNDGASHEDVTTDPRVVRPCAGPSIPGN